MEPRDDRDIVQGWPRDAEEATIQDLEGITPARKDAIMAEDIDHQTLRRCLNLRKPYAIRTEQGSYFDLAADTAEARGIRLGIGVDMEPGDPLEGYAGETDPGPDGDAPVQSDFHRPGIDMDPGLDPDNPVYVTRAMAKKAREREAEGVLMELPYTGGYARVRILELADKASLGWVPDHLRDKLAKMMNLINDPSSGGKVVSGTEAFARILKQTEDIEELANAFCIRGFVKPRLVAREIDLDPDDEFQMVVTDLHINERVSYVNACMPAPEEARILDPFRRRSPQAPSGQQGHKKATAAKPISRIR
jgi:hypothetical protein